ncbi:MAG: radical SAM protein [Alphaproteobacteria bacterium]
MDGAPVPKAKKLDPAKFRDPKLTAAGVRRAHVALAALRTLWINTGTLCNLTCANCYIESSPLNDRLAYITQAEVASFLDEIEELGLDTTEIGFTGGEPFMNPDIVALLDDVLARGLRALVLTNAMKPMAHHGDALGALKARFGDRLQIRVSLDHYTQEHHEAERGAKSWGPTLDGLRFLSAEGFNFDVAGRTLWGEEEGALRAGYARLFEAEGIDVDCADARRLVLFPEMDAAADVPEITEACWDILGVSPSAMMCAASRMVVKRKGESSPVVVPCTLLPYETAFEMGPTLAGALGPVPLNHPHCARFCVLGGGSCSVGA